MPTIEATSDQGPPKNQLSLIDRVQKLLSFSKSLFAVLAAFAALLLASSSEARRTQFVLYVLSRMWVELAIVTVFWCSIMVVRRLVRRMRKAGVSLSLRDLLDPRAAFLVSIVIVLVITCLPPLAYIGIARYRFWSSQVVNRYIEQLKSKVDGEVHAGKLDSALHTIAVGSDVLKGSAGEGSFRGRQTAIAAAVDRSRALDDQSTDAWNFVTQRQRFYSLVEALRVDPENSSASDHLAREMQILTGYLNDDAKTICALQSIPTTLSGKAVALVEARLLWSENHGSQGCVDQVLRELHDAWGIEPISCALKQSGQIRQGSERVSLDAKSCPPGFDFWTPLSANLDESFSDQGEDASTTEQASDRYPFYPTFGSLWRRFKAYKSRHTASTDGR